MLDDVLPQSKRHERLDREEVRRKSVDCGNNEENSSGDNKQSDSDVRSRKAGVGIDGPFVHFFNENDEPKAEFPLNGDDDEGAGDDDEGAIHIKSKNTTGQLTPDILKIA